MVGTSWSGGGFFPIFSVSPGKLKGHGPSAAPLCQEESHIMICGIVDLGSNTIRLSIYQCENGRGRLLTSRKVMAGLAGYVVDGEMSREGIQVACQTLEEYKALMKNLGFENLRVFATASLRNVSNTAEATALIQDATGLPVEVISGTEEARLSFLGAVGGQGPREGLLIDLGGGSTELVKYRERELLSSFSLSLGSLSLYRRFVSLLHPDKGERKAIGAFVREQLEYHDPHPDPIPHACGVGGTARAACKVANLAFGRDQSCRTLTAKELHKLRKLLRNPDRKVLELMLKAAPDRIHTLIPGLIVLDTAARVYGLEDLTVSPWGVREGYLQDRVLGGGRQ